MAKEDRDAIRSRLLSSALNEQDNRLAVQNALVIAKIARFEYPTEWPEAITDIITILRSQAPNLTLARALLILLQIVKELSTGRLQRTRQNLQAITPEIVSVLGNVYATTVEAWKANASHPDTEIFMRQSLIAMKALRRLLIAGYEHPNRDDNVAALWSLTQQHLGMFMEMEKAGHPHVTLIEKHMIQLAKLHHEMARDHPAAFALLPDSISLVLAYWSHVKSFGESFSSKEAVASAVATGQIGSDGDLDEDKNSMERLALKGLLIIRACVKMVHNPTQTFKYRTPEDKAEKARATEHLQKHLLYDNFIRELMEVLVTRFFVFRRSDLKEWEEEPEEWEKREEGEGDDWEFSVRSCSEKLFLDLGINYKSILVDPLLQVFYSVATPDNEDILFKDSVYTAIGLAAPVVHDKLDFDAFIKDVLVKEVQKQVPGYYLVRRRVAILLAQWITVKVSEDSKPAVYQIFQHLLNTEDPLNDHVVRVTAGRQFKNICDVWEFDAQQFMPYAETILTRIMQLIEEVQLTETRMALLNTISTAVERLDHNISPFAERIVTMLPPLWDAAGEEFLMKQAILTILARLVNAMKADSLPMHSLVFPIIRGAVEPGSETSVYLLDDAMDLWGSILTQTPAPASTELLDLVPYLFPIYELGSENMGKALEITESYVILAPEHILSDDLRLQMLTALSNLVGSLGPSANGQVFNLVEKIIRSADKLGGETAVSQTITDLVHVGFFTKLLDGLKDSWKAHNTTGPNSKDAFVKGIIETDYYSLVARLILGSMGGFFQACEKASSEKVEATMKWLLEEWFSHFENIADPGRRKLMTLALTKLLETNQPFILLNLQSLMTIWTDVITELREDDEDKGDSLLMDPAQYVASDYTESPETARRGILTRTDIVHSVNVAQWVKQYLTQTIAAVGGEQTFQEEWLVNVDRDVLASFSKLGVM